VSLARTAADLSTLENLPVPTAAAARYRSSGRRHHFGQAPPVSALNQERDFRSWQTSTTSNSALHGEDQALPALKHLPPGVHQVDVGDAKYMAELVTKLPDRHGHRHPHGVCGAVLLFARVLQPITILGSLLLSFGGAVAALWVTGNALSLGAMIGFSC